MDQGDRKRIKGNRIYLKAEGEQTFKKEEVVNIVKYHNQIQRMRKAKKKGKQTLPKWDYCAIYICFSLRNHCYTTTEYLNHNLYLGRHK